MAEKNVTYEVQTNANGTKDIGTEEASRMNTKDVSSKPSAATLLPKTVPPTGKKPTEAPKKRETLKEEDLIQSDDFTWKIIKLLGSGGFGDVYKVQKEGNEDKKEYAMKTEMVLGEKRLLRLKVEVTVLKSCHEQPEQEKKGHFLQMLDRGRNDKFKFYVMSLVGPSLEDIRKSVLVRNFTRSCTMQMSIQTLRALRDLHGVGWLHRDIKPANYAVGVGENEGIVYMLDFGIARKIFKKNSTEVKVPRSHVKFLGTIRFASRACHLCIEQGRKDDVETWLFMVYDLFDFECGLPWKRTKEREKVVQQKEQFFKHAFPTAYNIVPKEFKKICDYLNSLQYADAPDYKLISDTIAKIAGDNKISLTRKMDWVGKIVKDAQDNKEKEEESTDNKQSGGSDTSDVSQRKGAKSKRQGGSVRAKKQKH